MTITAGQQTALEKPVVPIAYFIQFDFRDGIVRVCNFTQTFAWNGYDWAGLGAVGGISEIAESGTSGAKALTFTLNIAQGAWLALALGPAEQYRRRKAKMWMCPLNENYQLIDTPVPCWRGEMDDMIVGTDKKNGTIQLKCETTPGGMRKPTGLRMNAAQHKKRYPTLNDTGFDQLIVITSNQGLVWVSKRFQSI